MKYTAGLFALLAVITMVGPVQVNAQQLRGTGEWQSATSDLISGKWTVSLTRTGGTLSGSLTLTGSNVFSGGDVSGTIDGSNVVLGVVADGVTGTTFSGKLNSGSISGEWESPAATDRGVWYGTLPMDPAVDASINAAPQP